MALAHAHSQEIIGRLLERQRELEFANRTLSDELEARKNNEHSLILHVDELSKAKRQKISLLRENESALRQLHEHQTSAVMDRLNALAEEGDSGEANIDEMQDLIEQYRMKKNTLNEHLRAIRFKQDCLVQELNDLHSLLEENYRYEAMLSTPRRYQRRKTTCVTFGNASPDVGADSETFILLSDSAESPIARDDLLQLRRDSLI